MSREETAITLPSDPKDRKAILDVIKDMSNQMTLINGHRTAISEGLKELSKKYELPQKYLRRFLREYHAQTFEASQDENEEYTTFYLGIVGDE